MTKREQNPSRITNDMWDLFATRIPYSIWNNLTNKMWNDQHEEIVYFVLSQHLEENKYD